MENTQAQSPETGVAAAGFGYWRTNLTCSALSTAWPRSAAQDGVAAKYEAANVDRKFYSEFSEILAHRPITAVALEPLSVTHHQVVRARPTRR